MKIRRPTLYAAALAMSAMSVLSAVPAQATTHSRPKPTEFEQINLISDIAGMAELTDPKVVNPWGIANGPALWVSNQGTQSSTIYGAGGAVGPVAKRALEVNVAGFPTGQVFNSGTDFVVTGPTGSGAAPFIFATLTGTIQGWNRTADATNAVVAATVPGAVFTGLTLQPGADGPRLLAADFAGGRIVVFDRTFQQVTLPARAFRDPFLPRGYVPFNVEVIGENVYVSYATPDPNTGAAARGRGKGFVSKFDATGKFVCRFASRGPLNAPWAITTAPASFGTFAGAILVGNFGNGRINAFSTSGRFLGELRLAHGGPFQEDNLWDLEPGTAANGGVDALWFSAGIQDEQHGLMGLIRPAPAA